MVSPDAGHDHWGEGGDGHTEHVHHVLCQLAFVVASRALAAEHDDRDRHEHGVGGGYGLVLSPRAHPGVLF